jgi:hypothetical protein
MESFVLDLCAFVLGLYVSPATGNPVVHLSTLIDMIFLLFQPLVSSFVMTAEILG